MHNGSLIKIKDIFLLAVTLLLSSHAFAQQGTLVRGQVLEESTEEFVPYANIIVKGTTRGVLADDSGYFSIRVDILPATLVVSSIGYKTKELNLIHRQNDVVITLKGQQQNVDAVVVKPRINPAHAIVRGVIKNKKQNNPKNISSYKADVYRKTLAQLKNIDSTTIEGNAVLRSLKKSLVEQPDSIKRYTIPLIFSEEVKQEVFSRNPYIFYDIPQVVHKEGVPVFEGANLFSDYIDIFSREINFYDDDLSMNKTPLVSPIAPLAFSHYHFRLQPDTVYSEELGLREYRIKFIPKNPRNAVFEGEMTVYDSIFALKSITAKLSPKSNVSFIIRYDVQVDYMPLRNGASTSFFINSSHLDVDFHLWKFKEDKVRIAANINMYSRYSNVQPNLSRKEIEEGEKLMVRTKKISNEEMQQLRSDSLSLVEQQSTAAMQELNKVWWVRASSLAATVVGSGFYSVGKFDIGPYSEMLKMNGMEGLRVNAALRTGNSFHNNFFAGGVVGMGCKDEVAKGSLSAGWKFNSRLRHSITLSGEYEAYRVGNNSSHLALLDENSYGINEDMLWLSLLASELDYHYAIRHGGNIAYEKEWRRWISSTLTYSSYNIESGKYVQFSQGNTPIGLLSSQELSLRLRISSNTEQRSDFFARRIYLSNGNLPIISPVLTFGRYTLSDVNHSDFYGKFHLAVKQRITVGATMLEYMLEAGAIFGAVPFPLLEGHRSIGSFVLSTYKFNLLYNLSLLSDNYASCLLEYNLNGALFNRTPLLRELNLKELLSCKILYNFQDMGKHARVMDVPSYVYARNSALPYVELGVGVQNIFQVLGVGCVWRLPLGNEPANLPYAYTDFSVTMRVEFGS
jgi:hypothetical protein